MIRLTAMGIILLVKIKDTDHKQSQIPVRNGGKLLHLISFNNPPPAEREVLGGPPEGGTVIGKPRWG